MSKAELCKRGGRRVYKKVARRIGRTKLPLYCSHALCSQFAKRARSASEPRENAAKRSERRFRAAPAETKIRIDGSTTTTTTDRRMRLTRAEHFAHRSERNDGEPEPWENGEVLAPPAHQLEKVGSVNPRAHFCKILMSSAHNSLQSVHTKKRSERKARARSARASWCVACEASAKRERAARKRREAKRAAFSSGASVLPRQSCRGGVLFS